MTATKAYDGSTAVSSGSVILSNLSGGQTINTSGSITTNSANVASYGTSDISVSSLSLADGTGAASNYTLVGGTYSATVTQKVLGLSGSRIYDATTTVSNSDLLTFNNIVSGESLTVTGSGTVTDQNVGTNKSVTLGTLALADNTASASNYNLSSATLNITQRP